MKQFAFTAQELFGMAVLAHKRNVYGIPNPFGTNGQAQMQAIIDELLDSGVAIMDMDGNASLSADYREMMDFLCDCGACVAIRCWQEHKQTRYALWRRGDRYLMAERMNQKYLFYMADHALVQAIFDSYVLEEQANSHHSETAIPQIALKKAHRLCADGLEDDALRVLRQYGAQERIALGIMAGLSGEAKSVRIDCVSPAPASQESKTLSYSLHAGLCLKLGQTVQNLRTCTVFTEIQAAEINRSIREISAVFTQQ